MIRFIRALTPLGRLVLGLGLLALVIAGLLLAQSWRAQSTAKAETRLSRNQTEAALNSGADAVGTIGEQIGREAAIDAATRENTDAIRSAAGASAPVPAAVDAVARERLCRRAVYRQRPECLQFAPAR